MRDLAYLLVFAAPALFLAYTFAAPLLGVASVLQGQP